MSTEGFFLSGTRQLIESKELEALTQHAQDVQDMLGDLLDDEVDTMGLEKDHVRMTHKGYSLLVQLAEAPLPASPISLQAETRRRALEKVADESASLLCRRPESPGHCFEDCQHPDLCSALRELEGEKPIETHH